MRTMAAALDRLASGNLAITVAGAERITDGVAIIDTIAGQTNLLALYATVEAARVGAAEPAPRRSEGAGTDVSATSDAERDCRPSGPIRHLAHSVKRPRWRLP